MKSLRPTREGGYPRLLLMIMALGAGAYLWSSLSGHAPLAPDSAFAQAKAGGDAKGAGDASTTGGTGAATTDSAGGAKDGDTPPEANLPTFIELFLFGPVVNSVLAVMSVIALALFGFFFMSISANVLAPPAFVDDVNKLIIANQYDQAANLCRSNRKVFVASVIQRCAENAGREHSVIMDMIDAEGRRRADMLWNRISYLADISNVAPMLGLLGTVLGMIKAFFGLQSGSGSIDSMLLAAAIGEAMATTMFGLIVGISALVFYSIVKARATKALAVAEQVVHSASDHMKRGS